MNTKNKLFARGLLFSGGLVLSSLPSGAASDTWVATTAGDWSNTANWLSGNAYADGVDAVATFSATGVQAVNLDTNITVGRLAFTNTTNTLSSGNGSVLTLATTAGAPSIDGSVAISATIAGTQGFTFGPGGFRNLTLSGNNTYSGVTGISSGGKLYVKSDNALGATGVGNGTTVTYTDSAGVELHFDSTAGHLNVAEDITLRMNGSGNGSATPVGAYLIRNDVATNSTTLTGTIVLDRTSTTINGRAATDYFGVQAVGTLNLNGEIKGAATAGQTTSVNVDPTRLQINATAATANVNINGVISNGTITTGGLSVYTATSNAGILRLSAANTYTGSTVHQKGTLLINNTMGSGTGTGAVSVASTAVFGGTGIVAPTGANGVTFATGSIVSPGNLNTDGTAISAGEDLTFDLSGTSGSVTFASGSTISINLNALASTVAESLAFIGLGTGDARVSFSNNVVNFSVTGGLLAEGVYTLASFSADNTYTGQWVLGSGLAAYPTAQLVHNANSIQLVIGSAIPEPSTAGILAGLFALGTVAFSRRRRP